MRASNPVFWLVITSSFLFCIGLLMVFNTTAAEVIDRSLPIDTRGALLKQVGYGLVGICFGLFAYQIGYRRLIRNSYLLMGAITLLLIMVFVPGIGVKINGANRWIGLFGTAIGQPSEFVKILLPLAYVEWYRRREKEVTFKDFCTMLAWFAIPMGLILIEPDNGTTLILFSLLVVLFFLSKLKMHFWALPLATLFLVGGVAAYQMPHVHSRVQVYLHPELDLQGKGHQPHQAKIAAGSGKLTGRGFGESLQKLNYLPEARSDYIAAIFAEEMGFIGVLVLVGLYLGLVSSGFVIAIQAKEKEAFLLAASLTFLIAIQAFVNLGVVCGLLPSKGMTLPFFSQGGSSLLVSIIAMFILIDISRKTATSKGA